MISAPPKVPVPLEKNHDCSSFDCGRAELNRYLQQFALVNQMAGAARTYVTARDDRVVGYYTLVYGSVSGDEATSRMRKGLARHPIPIMLLARLAVDRAEQGRGLGAGLLKDAILRTLQAADIAGLRGLVTHAKDAAARDFYLRYGFEPSPINEYHLMLLLKDARGALSAK